MLRQLGSSDLYVSPVAMGCWPIAGMTSLHVNRDDSLATLLAARECGINFFDTAYCYGRDGESERLIAAALGSSRDKLVLATKCGIHWDADGNRVIDGRPETLIRECEISLDRLQTDRIDLLYLHAPDPSTPLEESAAALRKLIEQGKARYVGASNFSVQQLETFIETCPLAAVQPPYNMLQRQIEDDLLPWCRERNVAAVIYWPLMKGLLAGHLPRDFQFEPGDGRAKYPMFQGEEWQKNQDFVDRLRDLAAEMNRTVAEIVVNWTIHQPAITAALCGAKRDYQIRETASAMTWELTDHQRRQIDEALQDRGIPKTRSAV